MKQSAQPTFTQEMEEKAYSKVTWRLMPLLFICFLVEYIARVNVGYARLQMQADLQLSEAIFGTAAGIFFIGYFIFEVPANILLQKIGAKYWLSTIMILSGIFCAAIMFSYSASSFYILRFLLGIVESGFFPGVILYLTFWYPDRHRAKVTSLFMTGVPLSGVVGGLISGWIMTRMANVGGLKGWQWLYLIEGLMAVVGGVGAMIALSNGPRQSRWLNDAEKEMMVTNIAADLERKAKKGLHKHRAADAFKSPQVWLFCLVYFGLVMATYGVQFWLPQIIADTVTKDTFYVSLISIIPWSIGAITMVLVGHHSDKTGERRWHIALSGIIAAVAFALSATPGISGIVSLVAITIATAGVMSTLATFWALPTAFLAGTAAAAGIAWINSLGNLSGYVSPTLVAHLRQSTGGMAVPLYMLAGCCLVASLIVVIFGKKEKH